MDMTVPPDDGDAPAVPARKARFRRPGVTVARAITTPLVDLRHATWRRAISRGPVDRAQGLGFPLAGYAGGTG
jgi:hypothetical protein